MTQSCLAAMPIPHNLDELASSKEMVLAGVKATWTSGRVRRWFARHPRFQVPFTPTGGSWINMVERFFGRITTEAIRRGSFTSTRQLREAIDAYIAEHNAEPKPFVWTATADSIFQKLQNSLS